MTVVALAQPIQPVPPHKTCAEVYALMAQDENLFAVPIVEAGVPLGLIDRIAMMSQFARPYWREVYSRRPITNLMDTAPVIADATSSGEEIGLRLTEKRTALNAGFILVRNGVYLGIGSTIDLLRLIADNARQRALELRAAHDEITAFNTTLERRVIERTEELHVAQQEIVRKERLSALGQLTATVAHELRNPLSSIRNTLFMLKEATNQASLDFNRPIGRMERSIERCDNIITELLDYTRHRPLRCYAITLDAWLEETLADLKIADSIVLARDFAGGDLRLDIDGERMRRVIINLVENAAQALAEHDGKRRITVGSRGFAERVELTVEDTGPGIPDEVLPKVFEPLFSTKSFGTGLGLPMVKQIVEQHGGTVTIARVDAGGTRVTVSLPRKAVAEIAA